MRAYTYLVSILCLLYICRVQADVSPFSTLDPVKDLGFVAVNRVGDATPSNLWNRPAPLPTNAWWLNTMLVQGISTDNNIFANPYVFQPEASGLSAMLPFRFAPGPDQVLNEFDTVVSKVTLTTSEALSGHTLDSFDELSVILRWGSIGNQQPSLVFPLTRGNPFISAFYTHSTPSFRAPQQLNTFLVDGVSSTCNGNTFAIKRSAEFSFIQSDETWRIYLSQPLTMLCSSSASAFSLTATAAVDAAVMRAVMINNCSRGYNTHNCPVTGQPVDQSQYIALVDKSSDAVVIGGSVSWKVNSGVADYFFTWNVTSLAQGGQPGTVSPATALMIAMPHHFDSFDPTFAASSTFRRVGFRNIRGFSGTVIANQWHLVEQIPSITFHASRQVDADKLADLVASIRNESNYDPPLNFQIGASDPYFAGKMFARMARLTLIAEELGEYSIAQGLLTRLRNYLEPWLLHTSLNPLVYDMTYGGIVSCGCSYDDCNGQCKPHCTNQGPPSACPALTDVGQDFGNAYYNDHHFHYGYHIYAAAVIAHLQPTWAQSFNERVLVLIRDVMNPSSQDPFFTQFRYKDWYAGHSWASGFALAGGKPYYNGRNQESVSEAVNFYYASYLYGIATNNQALSDLAGLMTAMELRGAHSYWQVTSDSDIYPKEYTPNGIVGILWVHLAQYSTWFGNLPYLVHGIQTLPNTPISELLLRPDWVAEELPIFVKACSSDANCQTTGWSTNVYLSEALINKEQAWTDIKNLPDSVFDNSQPGGNGHSRSNCLYFVATRPDTHSRVDGTAFNPERLIPLEHEEVSSAFQKLRSEAH